LIGRKRSSPADDEQFEWGRARLLDGFERLIPTPAPND
jgi:hypothetical protein